MIMLISEINFEKLISHPTQGTMYIDIVDTSRIDAPSKLINRTVINITKKVYKNNRIPFEINLGTIDEIEKYSLQIHIDVDNDKKISNGDFINVQNYNLSSLISKTTESKERSEIIVKKIS